MKISLIIAVYKDVDTLKLIFDALATQTYKKFEAVVVEDGMLNEMREFILRAKEIYDFEILHTTQEDKGVRKARSQNNGILASTGEYLIFIDGDCIPYSNFIEGHVALAEEKTALSGRRINIPISMVPHIKNGKIKLYDIEKQLWKYSYWLFNSQVRFKQGIYLNPQGLLYKLISKRDISVTILGCNFSCYKKDMIALNGFDESYGETAIPDDMDWDWRFKAFGIKVKSCKNVANIFHLDHKIHYRGDATPYLKIMNERREKGKYICEEGLNTHEV